MGNLGVAANVNMLRGTTHLVMACAPSTVIVTSGHNLRQLGDVRRDPSRLIAAQAAWSLTTTVLFLIVLPRSLGFPLGALGSSCISKAATLFVWCLLSRPASRHLMSG